MSQLPLSESNRVPLGFADLVAETGSHVAHFYQSTEEWKNLLVSYHKAGLDAGEKCVYVMKPDRRKEWRESLEATGADVEGALHSGQLVVLDDEGDVHERQNALAGAVAEIGDRYTRLRSGGDANLIDTHWEWEAHITNVADDRTIFLCQYDIKSFSGDVIVNALRTHPVCIVGDAIVRNPFYELPDVFAKRLHDT